MTPEEREALVAKLREDAIAQCRAIGCTCQPEPRLELIGTWDVPAWSSDHPDSCPATQIVRRAHATYN
jgi:hypothetical protein